MLTIKIIYRIISFSDYNLIWIQIRILNWVHSVRKKQVVNFGKNSNFSKDERSEVLVLHD